MNRTTMILFASLIFCCGLSAQAHFPWLIVNSDGKASLFFGENIADQAYNLPDSLEDAKVYSMSTDKEKTLLRLTSVDSDDFVGLISKQNIAEDCQLHTEVTYGIYHGKRLRYQAVHFMHLPNAATSTDRVSKGFSVQLVDADASVDAIVHWNGEPLSGLDVHLYGADGREEVATKTNDQGKASFSDEQVQSGLNGIMFGHTIEDDGGKLGEEEYASTMYYCTTTFMDPEEPATDEMSEFADLPFEITSFGAARIGDTAYVYGGHTGNAHSYSVEEQSNKLMALNLEDSEAEWLEVITGDRLQGLALVPHGKDLVLIGGFTAMNKQGEQHDLHSKASVKSFDTTTKQWSDLPALPAGRSSHDAAIIGDVVYVVGGWTLQGDEETQWHKTALKLDLSSDKLEWETIAEPPFRRRALATIAHEGLLYVIGGMNKEGGPTKEVQVYDPQKDSWKKGPELPGEGSMAGFGAAGWSVERGLVVSTYEGKVLKLAKDGSAWESIGKTEDDRFFHRLIPLSGSQLISVGGASMESGKFSNLEVVTVK